MRVAITGATGNVGTSLIRALAGDERVKSIVGELGWQPRHSAGDALRELLTGMAEGTGAETPPLDRAAGGSVRVREFLSGVGARN